MKKNILKISFIAALAIAAGFTAYSSQESTDLSGVSLANVEALAGGETGVDAVCDKAPNETCWVLVVGSSENHAELYFDRRTAR